MVISVKILTWGLNLVLGAKIGRFHGNQDEKASVSQALVSINGELFLPLTISKREEEFPIDRNKCLCSVFTLFGEPCKNGNFAFFVFVLKFKQRLMIG